jgi:hypothetical protein
MPFCWRSKGQLNKIYPVRKGGGKRAFLFLLFLLFPAVLELATFFISLHRWAFYRTIRTKHTAVARAGFQDGFTVFTFIKILTGIGGHFFLRFIITVGTGNN